MAVEIPWETIITLHITTYLSLIIILARFWISLRFVNIYKGNRGSVTRSDGEAAQHRPRSRGGLRSSMYADDWVALVALVPLLVRLPLTHMSFIYGGTDVAHPELLSQQELRGRQKGEKLLIASRLLIATYYWLMKLCIAIFYKRLVSLRKPYEMAAKVLIIFQVVVFLPTLLSLFLQCRPFHLNWQMIPRPPAPCVNGLLEVWIQGITDIVTNVILILFPIPIIVKSRLPRSKKIQLICLFSLGVIVLVITLIRLPVVVIKSPNSQFIRTLWSSIEVLFATVVANAPVIKSFVSGIISERKRRCINTSSGVVSRGIRSGGFGASPGNSNNTGAAEANKGGQEICMTPHGTKKRKGSLGDSDEESLNHVDTTDTARE